MTVVGDLALVWTPWRVILSAIFGFGFGYLVIASIAAQERWRTPNSRRAIAWLVGVLTAYFLMGLAFTEGVGALLDGDGGWVRVVSRFGPHLVVALGVALGVWRGLTRANDGRPK
jgi:hypothetical protein